MKDEIFRISLLCFVVRHQIKIQYFPLNIERIVNYLENIKTVMHLSVSHMFFQINQEI